MYRVRIPCGAQKKKVMTKQGLIDLIYDAVHHSKDEESAMDEISSYLEVLEPRDKEAFAKWGKGDEQTTPDKCWDI